MNSPTEQRLGAAFRDLVAEQPFIPDVAAIEHRARQARRRNRIARGGIGAGVVAVAAAVAVGVAGIAPSAPTGPAQASGTHPAGASASPTGSTDDQPPLMKLAAYVAAQPQPAGDATLVERQTHMTDNTTVTVWDLYTDDGRYFFSQAKAGLPAQIRTNNDRADGQFGREVAAATYAVTGNLHAAALKMAWPYATPVPAWLKAQVKAMAPGTQIVNYVWEDSLDALVAGSGNPQVRAGVLRLVSLLPGISIAHSTVNGQPALTLTETTDMSAIKQSAAARIKEKLTLHGKPEPSYQEAITINAKTGIPLGVAGGPVGKVVPVVSYVVTRVSLADIAAGKF